MNTDHSSAPAVRFHATGPAVHISNLSIAHPAVTSEALRWSTGRRGKAVSADELEGVDLRAYAEQAFVIGAQAITAAGGAQETAGLAALIDQLGERASRSTADAAHGTSRAVTLAGETVAKAARDARESIDEAGAKARAVFAHEVTEARKALEAEISRLFGGESPELLSRLTALLDSWGKDLDARSTKQVSDVLTRAAKAFDPADPTSPLARQQAELRKQSDAIATTMASNHKELATDVRELAALVREQQAAASARATLAAVTPIKGRTFESDACAVLEGIATALGEEFVATGATAGSVTRSKKGDGVLVLGGGVARVVVEMHDGSGSRDWNAYLDEAERNRDAIASLGLVPTAAGNAGQALRVLGPRRLVLAYSPGDDDSLLRSTVLLLRMVALAATSQGAAEDLTTAREALDQAVAALTTLSAIHKTAGGIKKNAEGIERHADSLDATLRRLLAQAASALEGAAVAAVDRAPSGVVA